MKDLKKDDIEFIHGDFCEADVYPDLVTLFDMIEHIPDPIGFLKKISDKCRVVGFHIPLDNSMNVAIRNLFLPKLTNPGHLIFLDTAFALNLIALAGLRVVDFKYTFEFQLPSEKTGFMNRVAYPFRWILAKISPWLLSKTLGGVSLLVLALTPRGLRA